MFLSSCATCPGFFATAGSRGQLKCDGTHTETISRLSAKRTSPFKSAGASVQLTSGSRGVRISGSNAGYTMFRGSVKGTGSSIHQFPLHYSSHASPCAITFQLESTTGTDFLELCVGQLMIVPEFQGHTVDDILVAVGLFIKIRKITRGQIRQVRMVGGLNPKISAITEWFAPAKTLTCHRSATCCSFPLKFPWHVLHERPNVTMISKMLLFWSSLTVL